MSLPGILDTLLILLLLGYFCYGWLAGLVRSVFGILGIILGGIAAFFAIPIVGSWIPLPQWRLPAIVVSILLLLAIGQSLGAWVGRTVRRQVEGTKLSLPDRIGGAVINVIVAALVASMLAFGVSTLGVPILSQSIASSRVLNTIDSLTPAPLKAGLAQLRVLVVDEGIPRIFAASEGRTPGVAPPIPSVATDSPALSTAARSVVKVTGTAWSCGQNQSGSGFVVAPDRIITNAHVIAGVTDPVIEVPGSGAFAGKVVYFDPSVDLAVIAVAGMSAPPIPLSSTLPPGSDAVFDGYPLGGPFQSGPARVIEASTVRVNDIYGSSPHPTEVYRLAANVQEGDSGGPLLSTSGKVTGVIFAKSADTANVGFALTMEELSPVANQAASYNSAVKSGDCIER